MENQLTVTESPELNKIVDNSGLQLSESETIKQSYLPYFSQIAEIKEKAKAINFENPTIADEKLARELRLATVKIRTGSESVKDERKRIHSLKANVEQSAWNLIKSTCQLDEETFLQVEKRREILEKQRVEQLRTDRLSLLAPHVENPAIFPVETMSEEAFNNLLEGQKLANKARLEAAAKAEADRIERERKEAEERESQRIENERLKSEAEAREKELAEQRKKAEAEKKALEAKAEKERKAQEEKLRVEREAREKLEAEIKAKEVAEAKAKKDAELKAAAELKAQQEAERKAKAAPDKAKLLEFANQIDLLKLPEVKSDEANKIADDAMKLLAKVSAFIREKSSNI